MRVGDDQILGDEETSAPAVAALERHDRRERALGDLLGRQVLGGCLGDGSRRRTSTRRWSWRRYGGGGCHGRSRRGLFPAPSIEHDHSAEHDGGDRNHHKPWREVRAASLNWMGHRFRCYRREPCLPRIESRAQVRRGPGVSVSRTPPVPGCYNEACARTSSPRSPSRRTFRCGISRLCIRERK